MLNNIYLEVEGRLGHDIKDILFDCRNLAIKLDMQVHVRCNGTLYMVNPTAFEDQIIAASNNPNNYVFVGG